MCAENRGLTGQDTGVEAIEAMVQQFFAQIIIQRLLRAVPGFVSRPSTPVTFIEAESHRLSFRRALRVLGASCFRRVQEGLVSFHANKRLRPSGEF